MSAAFSRRRFVARAAVAALAAIAGTACEGCAYDAPRCPAHPDRVKEDFAAGRTVVVDGWILSATEARECTLASILRV